ncbi:MAG: zinc-binding dehydrogenase [Solirubrobacteraceae bacterium]
MIADDVASAEQFGPYDLIVEQLGGRHLAEAMTQLVPSGTCVSIGVFIGPAGYQVPVDMARMRRTPGACLRILNVYQELEQEPASIRLSRLVRLVTDGKLTPHLGAEADWHEIGKVAQALVDRQFPGKAVLHISDETRPANTAGISSVQSNRPARRQERGAQSSRRTRGARSASCAAIGARNLADDADSGAAMPRALVRSWMR